MNHLTSILTPLKKRDFKSSLSHDKTITLPFGRLIISSLLSISNKLFVLFLAFNLLMLNVGNSMSNPLKGINCDIKIEHLDCDEDGTPNGEDVAPLDPCIGGTIALASNDCDGDGVTVGQGDTDDKDFCIPNPQPTCENYQAIEEEEIEFEEDPITTNTDGVTAIIANPCPTEVDDYGDCDGDGTPNNVDEDPFDACTDWTIQLSSNDCDGDGVTVGDGDLDDYAFCVPNVQPGCESYSAITEDSPEEEEIEFEVDPIIANTGGVTATITNPCPTEVDDYGDCDGDGTPNNVDEDPFDACTDWTIQLSSNDCDGDGVTVGDGDLDDYAFCVPNVQPGCESYSAITEDSPEEEEFEVEITDNNGIVAYINPEVDCQTAIDPNDCDGDGTPNETDEDPLDPCIGGVESLATNDCDGDGVTVGDGDPDDLDYCVPIESPECDIQSSNPDADSQIVLIAPCENSLECYSIVSIKALLQGAYDEDNPSIMHDKLRALKLLPTKEPYRDLKIYDGDPIPFKIIGQGDETVKEDVLNLTGEDAIVDWVFVQLHHENDPAEVVATRSALIQRDGDVVDTDGVSPLKFQIFPGKYYISIHHRNHLGVMTQTPMILSKNVNSTIDFSDINTPTFILEDSRKKSNHSQRRIDDLNYLWGGNSNGDWATIYQGPGLDQTKVFYDIFVDDNNKGPDGFPNYNFIKRGYNISDSNMDGEIRYQGPNNDVDDLQFFNIILHPDNPGFFSNKIIYEQIPAKNE